MIAPKAIGENRAAEAVRLGVQGKLLCPGPWAIPCCGGRMQAINAFRFYFLGMRLGSLHLIQEGDLVEDWERWCLDAGEFLAGFLGDESLKFSASVIDAGKSLADALNSFGSRRERRAKQVEPIAQFAYSDRLILITLLDQFESILSDELGKRFPLYLVLKKGAFDTSDLIDRADLIFTDARLRALLPDQATKDFRQGGRCLAFETPTAAGFHLFRATEAVIKRYYEILANKQWPYAQRDWGRYIEELKKVGATEKVLNLLRHIKDNYRNPLIHPEDNLDIHEALNLLGITQSAVGMMLQEISAAAP